MSKKPDSFGDRCKAFEMAEAGRKALPGIPLLVRLDGRAFHTFTRGLERPFDTRMMRVMAKTTAALVDEFKPTVGYTQSDEITLAFYNPPGAEVEYPFGGRFQKLTSVLSGYASAVFAREALKEIPEKSHMIPHFDARVWQVPSLKEATNVFIWREEDAVKNSVTMAAQAFYPHTELQGKNTPMKHDLLHAKGVNWNNYPPHFKRGIYIRRKAALRDLTPAELAAIPEKFRPTGPVTRTEVKDAEAPPVRQIDNREGFLFNGEEPEEILQSSFHQRASLT